MNVRIDAPKAVKREIMFAISAWNPRRDGSEQVIRVDKSRPAHLWNEIGGPDLNLTCKWSLERDPKTARPYWKVAVGPPEAVKRVVELFEHDFDDPLDMR